MSAPTTSVLLRDLPAGAAGPVFIEFVPRELRDVPRALRRERRWIVYWLVGDGQKIAKGKKPPVDDSGWPMETWHEPARYLSFADAVERLYRCRVARPEAEFHLGLADQGGVDLDGCRDPQTGAIDPRALAIVDATPGYVEVSPSGEGLKIFGRAERWLELTFAPDGIACAPKSPLFFAVTGNIFRAGNTREELFGYLAAIERGHEPKAKPRAVPAGEIPDLTPGERIAKAKRYLSREPAGYAQGYRPDDPVQRGDDECYRVCCAVTRGFDLDGDLALQALEPWNKRCDPPWPLDKLRAKVDGSRRTGDEPIGGRLVDKKPGPKGKATSLVELAWDLEMFRAPDETVYALTPVSEDVIEVLPIHERAFRSWLAARFYAETKNSADGGSLSDAVTTLAGRTRQNGKQGEVYIRVAAFADRTILDLGRDDRKALIIDRNGWRVDAAPEGVYLVRRPGMRSLDDPAPRDRRAPLVENLRKLTNVHDEGDLMMLTAWLVAALRGVKPFPILGVKGEQGSAKSSGCRNVRGIIDPSAADLSMTPKEPRDLVIAAANSYVTGYDNLSAIPDWLSDALSALSTGAGFRTRTLTTDREETIFSAARPIIVNGIPDLVRRGDLADRALIVSLDPITDDKRLTEAEVRERFAGVRAEVLGALADAVAHSIREPKRPARLPRMADFACVVESAAPALGWNEGAFLREYKERRNLASETLLDGDLVAQALEGMRPHAFAGKLDELLKKIRAATDEARHEHLPKSGRGLAAHLDRIAPALRVVGIDYTPSKRTGRDGGSGYRESRKRLARIEFTDDGQLKLDEPEPAPTREPGGDDVPF